MTGLDHCFPAPHHTNSPGQVCTYCHISYLLTLVLLARPAWPWTRWCWRRRGLRGRYSAPLAPSPLGISPSTCSLLLLLHSLAWLSWDYVRYFLLFNNYICTRRLACYACFFFGKGRKRDERTNRQTDKRTNTHRRVGQKRDERTNGRTHM